jgi:hypothetical protein
VSGGSASARKKIASTKRLINELPDSFADSLARCALMGLMFLVLIYTVAPTSINAVIKATHQWQAQLR